MQKLLSGWMKYSPHEKLHNSFVSVRKRCQYLITSHILLSACWIIHLSPNITPFQWRGETKRSLLSSNLGWKYLSKLCNFTLHAPTFPLSEKPHLFVKPVWWNLSFTTKLLWRTNHQIIWVLKEEWHFQIPWQHLICVVLLSRTFQFLLNNLQLNKLVECWHKARFSSS